MNRNDEQFDEFLRSQFKHKTFEMKDQHWNNAQQLIANHRATAGQGMLNAVFSGAVLVALSLGLLWNSANTPSAAKQEQTNLLVSTTSMESSNNSQNTSDVKAKTSQPTLAENTSTTLESSLKPNSSFNILAFNGDTKPIHRNTQHQRTRKSSLANKNTANPALSEEQLPTTTNTQSEVTYINGKVFRPIKSSSKELLATTKKPDYLAYTANRAKGFFTIEGGLNSYNQTADITQSLNFHGGVRYYRFLSPKFALSSGLSYSRLQQNLAAKKTQSIDYSFGQTINETQTTTLRLDYIEIPVTAYYNITGNHYLQAGATVGYAILSKNIVDQNGTKSESENVKLKGINTIDVQLNIGYACLIQNRYTFSAGYYMGLMDVSKNASFNSNKSDYNSGIRLTVGYKLF